MKEFIEFADKYGMLPPPGGLALAAVSGGRDSMCLLALLQDYACERGYAVAAAHYNHHLRGAESDRDARFVENYCREKSIPCTVDGGDVSALARTGGMGIEESARALRYGFLEATAQDIGAARIYTAHTADDNLETMLLNFTRGAGLRGLAGIPPLRGIIARPMLRVTRAQVEDYLDRCGIPHVEDSTNAEDVYTRNRIRHTIVPVLREINPGLVLGSANTAELLRTDEEYLESLAAKFMENHVQGGRVSAAALRELHPAVSGRVIRALGGRGLTSGHTAQVLALCDNPCPSARCGIPGMTVAREYGDIVFGAEEQSGFAPFFLHPGDSVEISSANLRVSCNLEQFRGNIHKSFTTFLFKSDRICGNINVRPRLSGDRICLAGRSGTRSVKKLMIDGHVPAARRQLVPVLSDDTGVLAVHGFGQDQRTVPDPGDAVLKIRFEEII